MVGQAVAKLVGGLDYRYAVRGDGQLRVTPVSVERQTATASAGRRLSRKRSSA